MKNYSKLGTFASKGRLFKEASNPFRSPFQRDRDRIIHSTSFRRLKHKTQVFVNTEEIIIEPESRIPLKFHKLLEQLLNT